MKYSHAFEVKFITQLLFFAVMLCTIVDILTLHENDSNLGIATSVVILSLCFAVVLT